MECDSTAVEGDSNVPKYSEENCMKTLRVTEILQKFSYLFNLFSRSDTAICVETKIKTWLFWRFSRG